MPNDGFKRKADAALEVCVRHEVTNYGEAVDVMADSSPFGVWLRRAIVDDYGNEVMSARGDQLPPS
jgi:hypothetical protein